MKRVSDKTRYRQKRGLSKTELYKPWIKINDFSSRGVSSRTKGRKSQRVHHLLSQLEFKVFTILDFFDEILDIKEQFPLHPISETIAIAEALGVTHPQCNGGKIVMTSDFLLQLNSGSIALHIKYSSDLKPRTLQKFEIERQYWLAHDIKCYIVTERDFSPTLYENCALVSSFDKRPPLLISNEEIIEKFERDKARSNTITLISFLENLAKETKFSVGELKHLFLHLLFRRIISFDLEQEIFKTTLANYEITK